MRRVISYTILFCLLLAEPAVALVNTKLPTGVDHDRAHRYATGQDVSVGVLDTVFYGIASPHRLGDRLVAQYSFVGKTPSQSPDPLASPNDDHERLVADIIAGDDSVYTGVAPSALIYDAAIDSTTFDTQRAAAGWLNANQGIRLFNLSAQFGLNTNGASDVSLFWDWFTRDKDTLLAVAAGNSSGPITIPGDGYNGISVGAYDQATQARAEFSAFYLDGGPGGSEVRGKPDILAPGVWVGDGISYNGYYSLGTSFAVPHVAGTAALLSEYATDHPTADAIDHLGLKAVILNSARKRKIVGPEVLSPVSSDYLLPNHGLFDKDYLDCGVAGCTIANPAAAGLTSTWTPAEWGFAAGKFSVTKPLDDEQGVGYLDADRAIINLAGGNAAPGSVAGIGWDQDVIQATDLPSAHTYAINQALAAGEFLTATLTWDRIVNEGDSNGVVNDVDTYTFGELANLDLRILNALGQVVAESVSTTDNVEHLHVPLSADGGPGDFKLQVIDNGGNALATEFALAWWTDPTPLVAGDYNLDGTVDALDYQVWRAGFGGSTGLSPLVRGDGNGDGVVDAADYAIWRHNVGESWRGLGSGFGGPQSVPEPASSILAALAVIGIFTIRRARL